jgi:hypothetical protein
MNELTLNEVEQRKELCAHMGAAMSCAADLEMGLIHALLALDFLSSYAEKIKREGMKNFDRPTYEREFDKFFADHQRLPMGELVKRFEKFAGTNTRFIDRLRDTLSRPLRSPIE